jgi:hypothetical protein
MNSMKRNNKRGRDDQRRPDDSPEEKPEPQQRVIERPDGFYWQAADGAEEHGPFTTLAEAESDMLSGGEADFEAGDLLEAESDIGVSEWIDPDTGGPAEDSVPRIEDH